MELGIGEWAVISVCAILILGYVRGYYYNRQKAEQILAWLQPGLEKLGKVEPGERLAGLATGGRLQVKQAIEPFRRVEAIFILAPRENLIFWLFHHLLGRNDELALKISLRTQPSTEIEVARRGDREFARIVSGGEKKTFTRLSGLPKYEAAYRGKSNADQLKTFLERYGKVVFRLSLRREQQHLFVRAYLPHLQTKPAEAFITSLKALLE